MHPVLRFALPALVSLSLSGCDSYTSEYQERLVKTLPYQREVSFSATRKYPGKVLCGEYTAIADNGFTTETHPYVVTAQQVMDRPRQDQIAVYCSDDPQGALLEMLGLSGSAQDWARLAEHVADMQRIHAALLSYVNDNYALPQTLDPLLAGEYGVTEETLVDGWGNRYGYEPGLSGRTAPVYELWTRGSDGENSSAGNEAAELRRQQVPLVAHVLALRN